MRTTEGFVVLQGSTISPKIKEQHSKANIVDHILQEDILFSFPSYAAVFEIGNRECGGVFGEAVLG